MEDPNKTNDDLAAALFFVLGEAVPHRTSLLEEAEKLKNECKDKDEILLKIISLCGDTATPKQKYLTAKAYSWLGKKYYRQAIASATDYLHTEGWDELSARTVVEDGILVHYAAQQRASVLLDLAKAQEGLDKLEPALFNFMEAYRLEPYRAMYAIKAADVVAKLHGREEALLFLEQQMKSKYYPPLRFTDAQGNVRHNELFKQLLDAQILKLSEEKPTEKTLFHSQG